MSTINEVVNAVISDMARENESGITSAVSNAISLAISHYETQPWYFLEKQTPVITANGTEYYDLPSDFGSTEVSFVINISGTTYPLIKRTYQYLESVYTAGAIFSGYPTDYAVYQQQLRMYPVPSGTYTANLSYVAKLGLPADGTSNAWTTDAELLIRSRAEWQLQALRYHDVEAASVAKSVEENALKELQKKNTMRLSTGKTKRRSL